MPKYKLFEAIGTILAALNAMACVTELYSGEYISSFISGLFALAITHQLIYSPLFKKKWNIMTIKIIHMILIILNLLGCIADIFIGHYSLAIFSGIIGSYLLYQRLTYPMFKK